MILGTYLFLLAVSGAAIGLRAQRLVRANNFVRLYMELTVPTLLVAFYGVFGLPFFFAEFENRERVYGVAFLDRDILAGFAYMTLAALSFWVGAARFRVAELVPASKTALLAPRVQTAAAFSAVFLLALDLYVRMQQIQSGVYFSWMRSHANELYEVQASSLWLLHDKLPPILVALLLILALRQRLWIAILLGYLFLMLLTGHRTPLFQAMIVLALCYLQLARHRVSTFRMVQVGVAALAAGAIVSSVVIDVRKSYRAEIGTALADPTKFILDVATVHVPNALNPFDDGGPETTTANVGSTTERLSFWSAAFSSQLHMLDRGASLLPRGQFFDEALLWVPSAFYPGTKPPNIYGSLSNQHLGIAWNDPATTIFSSMFLHWHLAGAVVFAFVVGSVWGAIAQFLTRRAQALGAALFFGSCTALEIQANSFGAFFSGLRDYTILITVIAVVFGLMFRVSFRRPKVTA